MNYYDTYTHIDKIYKRDRIAIKNIKGDCILDIGCGDGKITKVMSNIYHICGIDVCEEALKQAKRRGYNWVHCLDINKEYLPDDDSFFDTALCLEVLEHLTDPIFALAEINRVLKFNGRLIISTNNIACIYSRLALLFGFFCDFHDFQLVPCHIRFYTIARMKYILKLMGFSIDKVYGSSLFSRNPVFIATKVRRPEITHNSYYQITSPIDGIKKLWRFK
jgi:ubiquinone/menaquinone biosynthesis C-methylase UbiE